MPTELGLAGSGPAPWSASSSDSESAGSSSLGSLSPESDLDGQDWTAETGSGLCNVSRRLGTIWIGESPPSRDSLLPVRRKRWSRARAEPERRFSRNFSAAELNVDSLIPENFSPTPTNPSFPPPSDEMIFADGRRGFTDPYAGDNSNCLNCFAAYDGDEYWSLDSRLTLVWCLAYEARFRRLGPAVELWLGIIKGGRQRVDWNMWEEGDEGWLRDMIIRHRMAGRFKAATAGLCAADWRRAQDAIRHRLDVVPPGAENPLSGWIAWCVVTDLYMDLIRPMDAWAHFTLPFRPRHDENVKLRLHTRTDCAFSACKVGVWQWFITALPDYDSNPGRIQEAVGCCSACVSRASLSLFDYSTTSRQANPAIWPVILWVAFRIQTRDFPTESRTLEALLAIIQAKHDEHLDLWSWDDTDESTLRLGLLTVLEGSPWTERYPPSWQEHLVLLDTPEWSQLAESTRQSGRSRIGSPDYDTALRICAIMLWTSSKSESQDNGTILCLDRFIAGGPANLEKPWVDVQFLLCFLQRRTPIRAGHYTLNLGPETVDWRHPRIWLDRNRAQLRASVLHDPDTVPLINVVETVYMVQHVPKALPLRLISSVFACLLRRFRGERRLDEFRAHLNLWKSWDTTTCLANFRSVLATTLEFSKSVEDKDLPKYLINVVIHTDIQCICAQIAVILRDRSAYKDFVKARDDDAQKLLDLFQDLLDYQLLDASIRPVILKALMKLSSKSGRHPRCFALTDLQLEGPQVAAGSFGDVYKGSVHGETVSVKVMRVFLQADVEALLKEFYHEALIWRQLSHPNLLPFFGIYYLEDTKNRLCLVSPWMENGNIVRYLKDYAGDINRLNLVLDIALGLQHLHSWKLVHGDLKGINVLVTRSGRAVLAEFGLSSVTDSKILLLSTSTVKTGGTMRWQAPELLRGDPNSFASDVYAFSCVCYEVFTGNLPFYELYNDAAVMFRIMNDERPSRSPAILDSIWDLMLDCWKTKPEARPLIDKIVFRLRDRPIYALPANNDASDWDPWYTSKFRSSLEEHTLFLPCGKIDDWLQFTQPDNNKRRSSALISARSALSGLKGI
ncbi:hypothetical protein FB45DRAFT_906753 [Roridomyces roridus]|uniref:Protein kinase domain-containing protein n=1 Tax=Roridomyces roridus TaxID=1738132 RepID=A0AAD7C1Q7_9AGAR|nr:hypothetical protein FB45DRAFT_906753 [Roridomyces roridus]